jgi:hypothetical protein
MPGGIPVINVGAGADLTGMNKRLFKVTYRIPSSPSMGQQHMTRIASVHLADAG